MANVFLFGEPLVLFGADDCGPLWEASHYTKYLAGAEVNVCIGLTRLGHRAYYHTKLGKDPFGIFIDKKLAEMGIIVTAAYSEDRSTGFYLKNKVAEGDPDIFYFRKGSAAASFSPEDLSDVDFSRGNHLHLTGIPLALSHSCRAAAEEMIKRARENGMTVSFDPNIRPSLWKSKQDMIEVINSIGIQCDYILPGMGEAQLLTGAVSPEAAGAYYLERGVRAVFLKSGAAGAYAVSGEGCTFVPGFRAKQVVDTVGAGDGFAAGVISGLLEGLSYEAAVKRGNAIGALQVQVKGDNEGLPDRDGLKRFMDGAPVM